MQATNLGKRSQLFAVAQGRLVETIASSNEAVVEFSAQGGGFVQRMPRQAFDEQFKPATLPGFRRAAVTADWLPEGLKIPAYINGQRWNGWAMPYFAFDAASQLLQHLPNLRYDEDADAFISKLEGYPPGEDEEVFRAETLSVDGVSTTVYAVGAGCWTWDFAD